MNLPSLSRRDWLKTTGCGFGYMALAGLTAEADATAPGQPPLNPLAPKTPHFTPRAKRVIFLFMHGGPSHVDTFDYKPALQRDRRQERHRRQRPRQRPHAAASRRGSSSRRARAACRSRELFPNLARHADDLCLLNSMHTDVPNHPQSCLMLHTGEFRFTRPSMGSWMLYGLGTENQDLPGFITINPPTDLGGAQNYGNAFLPAAYQATRIGEQGTPVAQARIGNLDQPQLADAAAPAARPAAVDEPATCSQRKQVNPELEGVINSFELASACRAPCRS